MKKKPKPPGNPFAFVVLAMVIVLCIFLIPGHYFFSLSFGEEVSVMLDLAMPQSPEAREKLVTRLESIPEKTFPFFKRWMSVQDINPFRCWSDTGYDPSHSKVPRDI